MAGTNGEILARKETKSDIFQICGGREVYHDTGEEIMCGGCIIPYAPSEAERKSLVTVSGTFQPVPRNFDRRDRIFHEIEGLEPVTDRERKFRHRDAVAKFVVDGEEFWVKGHALEQYLHEGRCVSRRTGLERMHQHFSQARRERKISSRSEELKRELTPGAKELWLDRRWAFVISPSREGNKIMTCYLREDQR